MAIILLFSTSCSIRSFGNVFIFLKCQQGWNSVCQLKSVPLTKGNIRYSTGMFNVKVACLDFRQRSWNNSADFTRILFGKERTAVGDTEVMRFINRYSVTDSKNLAGEKLSTYPALVATASSLFNKHGHQFCASTALWTLH